MMSKDKILKDFEKKAVAFINSSRRNEWIEVGPIKMYLRHSRRLNKMGYVCELMDMLDIANLSVAPNYQGRGLLTAAVKIIEDNCTSPWLYVENISYTTDENQQRLVHFFERRGFIKHINSNDFLPCMVKAIQHRCDLTWGVEAYKQSTDRFKLRA